MFCSTQQKHHFGSKGSTLKLRPVDMFCFGICFRKDVVSGSYIQQLKYTATFYWCHSFTLRFLLYEKETFIHFFHTGTFCPFWLWMIKLAIIILLDIITMVGYTFKSCNNFICWFCSAFELYLVFTPKFGATFASTEKVKGVLLTGYMLKPEEDMRILLDILHCNSLY